MGSAGIGAGTGRGQDYFGGLSFPRERLGQRGVRELRLTPNCMRATTPIRRMAFRGRAGIVSLPDTSASPACPSHTVRTPG